MTNFNADLINDIAQRRVVIFLGAGVSASAKTRSGNSIRAWSDFLIHAASKIEDENVKKMAEKLIEGKDYLLACEVIRRKLDADWTTVVAEEFSQVAFPSPLHEAIINLDQRIILTTNFDKLIETAWGEVNKESTHYPRVISKVDSSAFRMLRDSGDYIVKLHGTVDDPSSFIFTKSEYIERAFGSWVYTDFVSSLLATHTLLFIGFSMADPAVTLLVERHASRFPDARPHYIVQAGPVPEEIIQINKELRRLFVITYDASNKHEQLPALIRELGEKSQSRRREIIAEQAPISVEDSAADCESSESEEIVVSTPSNSMPD
ncbi:SIR2 family protein [Xanthomonas arboricola pv. pruni]|uniref:SIR2 family protein n=1 Tax=Xanthomonas arboricola TaxID=56448 RepID=UPI003556054B